MSPVVSFSIGLVPTLALCSLVFRGPCSPEIQVIIICASQGEAIAAENHLDKEITIQDSGRKNFKIISLAT